MPRYQALWKVVEAAGLVELPEGAVGVTVTPALDGGPTIVVAWLHPLERVGGAALEGDDKGGE